MSKARPGDGRKDRATGRRVKKKVDPDKRQYHEGGGAEAWGAKFLPIHTKTAFGWVVLDIPHVPGVSPADEANVAVETLREIRPLLPGPHFHVHDGAMTSEHNQALHTELGTALINRPKARSNPKIGGKSIGEREPDEGLVEVKPIERPDGSTEMVALWQVDGEYGLMDITEVGESHFVPVEVTKLHIPENKTANKADSVQRYRPYVGLKVPEHLALRIGRREITAALYQTSKDKERKYLRSAHVRAIGPSNPDFRIYKKMRGDSESLNRVIEDSLYRNHRAHSDGAASQEVDMLGLAGLINALTRERMRLARLAQAA